MGWRERDWAKFTDEERTALFGGGRRALPPSAEGADFRPGPVAPRTPSINRAGRKISTPIVTVLTIALATTIVVGHLRSSHVNILQSLDGVRLRPPTSIAVQRANNVIAIRWRSTDLAPAPEAGQICVAAASHGRICASYVVGERPADTLTREIEALGLRVESTGGD
jgi:hypothetical protein